MNTLPLRFPSWMALAILPCLASCTQPQDEVAAAQAAEERVSLERSKTEMEKEMKLLKADFEKRQAEVIRKNEELMRSNDELKARFEKAQDEAADVRREMEDYRIRYKLSMRAKAKGLTVPRIETVDNAVFEKVVVKELTPKEVAFSHSGGISRLPLTKLPPDLQHKFLYDPEEVKASEAAEAAGTEAVKDLTKVAGVVMRDPTRPVDATAVRNLTNRILTREAEIAKAEKEAVEVKKSSYGTTNIAQYRVQQLGQRAARLKSDIVELRVLLEKQLNGPQPPSGATPAAAVAPQSGTQARSQGSG